MLAELRTSCGLCGLCADGDGVTRGPTEPSAPEPAEGAGCSGSPEGRCTSFRDGPTTPPQAAAAGVRRAVESGQESGRTPCPGINRALAGRVTRPDREEPSTGGL